MSIDLSHYYRQVLYWGGEADLRVNGKIMEITVPPMSTDAIPITHLPSGRFVYGHKYLQPFEFTSFWSSSSNNRSGVPERRFDAHEFQESQRLMNSDTFVISKSGERKSIDELRCPNDVPRRSLEEHRSTWNLPYSAISGTYTSPPNT